MVLTTVPIEQLASDKITPIHHLLDDGELAAIERRFFAPQDDLRGEIAEFFRRDCFYAGKTLTSRDDILMFLTGELRAKGLMDAAEQASVFEREKASPTEIGHLVAIPHPIYADPVRSTIAVLTLSVPDNLRFLDWTDPDLEAPVEHTAEEFISMLTSEESLNFASQNVNITFGADGTLEKVERFYTPWQ